jgi:hypothetical protein
LALDYMEKNNSTESLIIEGITMDDKTKLFGLYRIQETFVANFHRIEYYWDILLAHYACLSHAKNTILRAQAIENLNSVIEKYFQLKTSQTKKDSESPTRSP